MLDIAIRAAREAGRALLEGNRREIRVDSQSRRDVKLEMDRKAEEIVINTVLASLPGHAILSEERGRLGGDSEYLWVIDPLDGTYNFSRRIPVWCTSVGLMRGNEFLLGAIYDPISDEMYSAERGKGAFVNGRPARVSDIENLADAAVCFSCGLSNDLLERTMSLAARLALNAGKVRGMGAAASHIAYVGAGRADAFFDFGAKLWDIAAGVVIVEEAGGKVTIRHTGDNTLDLVASNGRIHDALLREMDW